ncbi:NUDIX hydrolase domain-like protein [Amylocystis lapponica]|nr:NUDIX hydrolase domain-like protein [Amylocystis lapponica]
MLSAEPGSSFVNFMGGSPLNRLSWLRTSQPFLNAIVSSATTRWIVFRAGQPLLVSESGEHKKQLARLSTADVRPLLGTEPFFAQGQLEGEHAASDVVQLQAARLHGPPIVFLGLHEPQTDSANALPSSDFSGKDDATAAVANIEGTPYFALDVTEVPQEKLDEVLQGSEAGKRGAGLLFMESRMAMDSLDAFYAGVFAQARSMVDWQSRNKFCPSCGSPVYPLWAGWKLSCTSLLPWAENTGRKPCLTATGLHNFSHPRTDGVVIMAVLDESGEKVLLGRNRKWPGKMYSALAGFMEPGESFEDAVKRELWEEAGVAVWDVQYHSTQPWPYPANIMVGFYAVADSSKPIRTDLDNELEEARWFTREEILTVLNHTAGTKFTVQDHQQLSGSQTRNPDAALEVNELPFRLPPRTAIAGVLVSEWALGRAGHGAQPPTRGNL